MSLNDLAPSPSLTGVCVCNFVLAFYPISDHITRCIEEKLNDRKKHTYQSRRHSSLPLRIHVFCSPVRPSLSMTSLLGNILYAA